MTLPESYVYLRHLCSEWLHTSHGQERGKKGIEALDIIERQEILLREENLLLKEENKSLKETIAVIRTPREFMPEKE